MNTLDMQTTVATLIRSYELVDLSTESSFVQVLAKDSLPLLRMHIIRARTSVICINIRREYERITSTIYLLVHHGAVLLNKINSSQRQVVSRQSSVITIRVLASSSMHS